MKLSPLYETLIYIEHYKKINSSQLFDKFSSRSARGVIGKMEAMNLVEKDEEGELKLSKKGHQYLNLILANLHEPVIKWDGMWTLLSFIIPEKKKSTRDKFRRFVESIGMKPLFNGIWISPANTRDGILEYAKRYDLNNKILVVRTARIFGIEFEKLKSLWDFENSRNLLEDFISEASKPAAAGSDQKFEAKKKIFYFASILEQQPKVPLDIFPKDWPYLRARMAYKKLKSKIA